MTPIEEALAQYRLRQRRATLKTFKFGRPSPADRNLDTGSVISTSEEVREEYIGRQLQAMKAYNLVEKMTADQWDQLRAQVRERRFTLPEMGEQTPPDLSPWDEGDLLLLLKGHDLPTARRKELIAILSARNEAFKGRIRRGIQEYEEKLRAVT